MQEMLHLQPWLNSSWFDLCFVWKIPKVKDLCWVNLSWLTIRLAFSGFCFLAFFGELYRHHSLDAEGFREQQFKTIALQNASLFLYATNLYPHMRKGSTRCFTLYLIEDFNSTMEQQPTEQIEETFYFIIYPLEEIQK